MKRKIPLDPLKFEVALHWAEQTAAIATRKRDDGASDDNSLCSYRTGVKHGYMQAIADLRMHGYLEAEK